MAEYRLQAAVRTGLGTITINGVAPVEFYAEATTLTIAVSPDSGFHTAKWYSNPGNTLISSALSFSFTMPSNDVKLAVELSGQNVPVNDYGLKYEGGYATNYGGLVWNLQILRTGYSGAVTPLSINDITYNWGNTGNDPINTIIGSSVDFTIAGETGEFNEFLVGGNRTWKVLLNQIGDNNDITNWQQVNNTNNFKSVAYGNGKFIALPSANQLIWYSIDGINWTAIGVPGFFASKIAFGNGQFVSVGGILGAQVFTSVDGFTWTSRTPAITASWNNVHYANGLWVAVALNSYTSGAIMTSPDGITWTSQTMPVGVGGLSGLTYGKGVWVATTIASPATFITSFDGFTWSDQSTGFGSNTVFYENGIFTTGYHYSTNGINWIPTGANLSPRGITYGNGYFIAVIESGVNRIFYSQNGISWTGLPVSNTTFLDAAFGNNVFVAVGQSGTNRINYVLFEGVQPFFTGFIAPDFITSQFKSGPKLFSFTAIDGLKGLDSIRSNFTSWPDPRTQAISGVVGALNQSFIDKRKVLVGCEVHENRMNSDISVFRQFNVPQNAIYTDGEVAKFTNGVRIENEQLYLKDTIERLVNPFLCRVFLWKDKFYVIRLNEFNKTSFKAYTFNPDTSIYSTEMIINGDDINADINRPEETARRVFTEFNAFLNLGILDQDSQGGVFDAKFEETEWNLNSPASTYPNTFQLKLWDYVRAIPSNQPTSVPSGATALVQYVSDGSGEYVQIWTTTTTDGIADPNISYISANTNSTGRAITIAQETANTISLTFKYMVERVSTTHPVTPNFAHAVGLMVKIGNQFLSRTGATTFAWTTTSTVMEFPVTTGSVWNSIAINNVLVPVDGNVEIRLYQLICKGGTPNRYVIRYDDLSLKIEKTSGLSLAKLGVKGVTGSPYANIHPDYNTFIGDAITSNSASAIRLINVDNEVSESWSRDGLDDDMPLLDIIVQELANLKGRTNYRIIATLERREIEPFRSFLFNGRYWALVSYQLNCRTGTAQIELYDLGIEPTT